MTISNIPLMPQSPEAAEVHSAVQAAAPTEWQRRLRKLRKARVAMIASGFLVLVALVAVTADWLAPYDPNNQELRDRLLPPAWLEEGVPEHILGTDHLGRDLLSRLMYGSRVSLTVGLLAVVISGVLGVGLGLLAGYAGGSFDSVIMRIVDVMLAFPFVLLALAIVAVLGSGLRNVIIVLGISGWMVYTRVVRAQVLSLKEMEYVTATRALGGGGSRIVTRHILPNVLPSIVVIATFAVATNIILEASLTFLGVGVESKTPTWGSMLSDGRAYIATAWWLATIPGLAIMFTVLSINIIGDWVRDVLDPHLKNV